MDETEYIDALHRYYLSVYHDEDIASCLTAISIHAINREEDRLEEIAEQLDDRFDPWLYAQYYLA